MSVRATLTHFSSPALLSWRTSSLSKENHRLKHNAAICAQQRKSHIQIRAFLALPAPGTHTFTSRGERPDLAGKARKRFGGNIPLIGICNWGNIQQRAQLEVSKDGVKLGYLTSPPVRYEKMQYGIDARNPALDPNHSHFIMVLCPPPLTRHANVSFRLRFRSGGCRSNCCSAHPLLIGGAAARALGAGGRRREQFRRRDPVSRAV